MPNRYDCVLHSKFRFRSATFFKTSRLELACEKHKDRVLVTGLRTLPLATAVEAQAPPPPPPPSPPPPLSPTGVPAAVAAAAEPPATEVTRESHEGGAKLSSGCSDSDGDGRLLMVVNCHLTGGPVPERRMRQVLDGLDTARKEAAKLLAAAQVASSKGNKKKKGGSGGSGGGGGGKKGGKGTGTAAAPAPGTTVPVVVCGDFNSNGRTAVWELLTSGLVEASFRERGYPEVRGSCSAVRKLYLWLTQIAVDCFCGGVCISRSQPCRFGCLPTPRGKCQMCTVTDVLSPSSLVPLELLLSM